MITRENLKQIVMLTYLTDDMLDELIPITELLQFDEKEFRKKSGAAVVRDNAPDRQSSCPRLGELQELGRRDPAFLRPGGSSWADRR